jgi:integrase
MRPGEVCNIKTCWIDKDFFEDGQDWLYLPDVHKTAGKGKSRPVVFTKTDQEILKKYIKDDPNQHLFLNSKGKPFTTRTYGQAVKKIIDKHGLPKFTLYQIRRNVAVWGDEAVGIDGTRAALGHADETMTRWYLDEERDIKKVREFAVRRERALAAAVGDGRSQTADGSEPPILRIYRGEEGGAV